MILLENYIEKNIFRQTFICHQLYLKKKISIKETAKALDSCPTTINNDIEVISEVLSEEIADFEHLGNFCIMNFKVKSSLQILTQKICKRSNFLLVLNDYLLGSLNWTEIAEKEFLSTSKIYQIRTQVFSFAEELGYLNDNKKVSIPEKDLRYLLLSLSIYTGDRSAIPANNIIKNASERLITFVEKHFFSRVYPHDERQIILLGIQLSCHRARHSEITFSFEEKEAAKKTPLFNLITAGLKALNISICANEEELFFIYSLFNARPYLCNNLELLKKDLEVVYQNHIHRYLPVENLFNQIKVTFKISKQDEILLLKAFLPFIRSSWANMQLFQPELFYILKKDQLDIYYNLLELLNTWAKENNQNIKWNDNLVRKITLTIDVLKGDILDEKIDLYIVTPSDFKFLYYKRQLNAILDDHFNVSDMIYNSLDEVIDDNFFCSKRIVICDESLLSENSCSNNVKIYPVSINSITEKCFEINKSVRLRKKD